MTGRCDDAVFGSDLIIETLSELGIDDAVINPGASLSGLHESLESSSIDLHLALHENVAVAMADGYARVTGKPMAVFLHNLVGLQSGTMGIFNAWVNQVPVCIYGGAGPESWTHRRPWIDWIHSAKPQTAAVRDVVKWHAQPADVASSVQAVHKAHRLATAHPPGPTYVAIDSVIQEQGVASRPRTMAPVEVTAELTVAGDTVRRIAQQLHDAARPVIVADLVGRSESGFEAVRQLAALLGSPIIDLAGRHNLDTSSPLNASHHRVEVLGAADAVLALDCRDLGYALNAVGHRDEVPTRIPPRDARVIDVSLRPLIPGGFVDYASTEQGAWLVTANTEVLLPAVVETLRSLRGDQAVTPWWVRPEATADPVEDSESGLSLRDLARVSWEALRDHDVVVANGDLRGWLHAEWELTHRLAFLGKNLGAGLGYGSGAATGAAIGLRRHGRDAVVVNFQNDGDFLYTPQALWTQARYRLPIITFVVDNGSYGQDRRHSQRLAELRDRPDSARPEGIDFDSPRIDFTELATAQGVRSWGPIGSRAELKRAVREAVDFVVANRAPALVDVRIESEPRLVAL